MKTRLSALALGVTLSSGLALAQSADFPSGGGPGLKDWAWAGAALILVLVLMVMLLKAVQRVGRFKGGRGALFVARGHLPLDNRNYLAAVAVEGRLMIIGVTPDRLIPLGQWPLKDEAPDLGFTLPAEDDDISTAKEPGR
jgi:flagellar biogenesis protein FliO